MGSGVEDYDVVIVGAGPAGATCALALQGAGLKVALIDKSEFPRDKTCGDSIPGPAIKILHKVLNDPSKEVDLPESKQKIRSSSIYTASGRSVTISWKAKAYNCRRIIFDQFLIDLVKKHTNTHVYLGDRVDMVAIEELVSVHLSESDRSLSCHLVIGCDGANSIVSRTLAGRLKDNDENCIAVRAYFKDVDSPEDSNNFYLLKSIPGYFWIFPLGSGVYNTGMGLRANFSGGKFNIKDVFNAAIEDNPLIREKFSQAKKLSDLEVFRLPMGGYRGRISGERFILTGDAASLIDPLQGHGIDKAMHSGLLAAQQAVRCFQHHDFTETFISGYDDSVAKSIGKELWRNYRIMKLLYAQPWVINLLATLTTNKRVKALLLKGFYRS